MGVLMWLEIGPYVEMHKRCGGYKRGDSEFRECSKLCGQMPL